MLSLRVTDSNFTIVDATIPEAIKRAFSLVNQTLLFRAGHYRL